VHPNTTQEHAMHTLEVTDDQLHLLHESINSWINSFSHDQPDLLRAGKELRAKIDAELGSMPIQAPAAAFDPELHRN
jgi:hypothetical protein